MSEKMPNSSTKADSSGGETSPRPARNQFQKSGSEKVYEVMETKNACVIRIDVPGVPESQLTCWIVPELKNVVFSAVEPAKPEYNYVGRKYEGMMVLPDGFVAKEAKTKIADGVLWITIPRIPGTNAPLGEVRHIHLKNPEATA